MNNGGSNEIGLSESTPVSVQADNSHKPKPEENPFANCYAVKS